MNEQMTRLLLLLLAKQSYELGKLVGSLLSDKPASKEDILQAAQRADEAETKWLSWLPEGEVSDG